MSRVQRYTKSERKVVLFYPLDNIIVDIQPHICNGMQRYVNDWSRSEEVLKGNSFSLHNRGKTEILHLKAI